MSLFPANSFIAIVLLATLFVAAIPHLDSRDEGDPSLFMSPPSDGVGDTLLALGGSGDPRSTIVDADLGETAVNAQHGDDSALSSLDASSTLAMNPDVANSFDEGFGSTPLLLDNKALAGNQVSSCMGGSASKKRDLADDDPLFLDRKHTTKVNEESKEVILS